MTSSSSSSPEVSAATGSDSQDRFSYKHATHDEVLEDLSSRFILNLPDEELTSLERICFQVEQAHWFYEDFIREENPKFPSLPLKKFSAMLFHACPLLHHWSHDHEQAFNTFMQYKTRVPVCGAILLNDTWEKCVLVKGWKSSSGWGFPKGKINEDEPPANCAVREVLEETGYNLASQIDPKNVIEMSIKEQKISLFIVPGVPEDYPFKTKTRKEISKIEWFRLTDLPTWRRNKTAPGRFYLISPFIGALKAFINENKPRKTSRAKKSSHKQSPTHRGPTPYTASSDAQNESSSQSSSAENGEPHTPSPNYTEPIANPISQIADGETIEEGMSVAAMDPHFAKLLSSLTMSASLNNATHPEQDKKQIPISNTPKKQTSSVSILGKPSRTSPTIAGETDWSTSVPGKMPSRTNPLTPSHDSATASVKPSKPISQDETPRALPHHSLGSIDIQTHADSLPITLDKPFIAPPISPINIGPPPRFMPAHRSSSIADLSPYLSRPSEAPKSAKTLQQLALLETVADESARMSPFWTHTAPAVVPPVNYNAIYHSSIRPPSAMAYDSANLRVMYASGSPAQPIAGRPNLHMSNGTLGALDSYQSRSKTSHAYHRNYPNGLPGSLSMNQSQLLAVMNRPHLAPPTPHIHAHHIRGPHVPSYHTPISDGYPPIPASNLMYPGPPTLVSNINPPPFTTSISTPGIYDHTLHRAPPLPVSGSLLSILNNRAGALTNIATSPRATYNGRILQSQ